MASPPLALVDPVRLRARVGVLTGDRRAVAAVYALSPAVRIGLLGRSLLYDPDAGDGERERLSAVGADRELYEVPRPDEYPE